MLQYPFNTAHDEELLGRLAMQFRHIRDSAERRKIAAEYADTVLRLIDSGQWHDFPDPEEQLPDDRMPREFFEYWSRRTNSP